MNNSKTIIQTEADFELVEGIKNFRMEVQLVFERNERSIALTLNCFGRTKRVALLLQLFRFWQRR